MSKELFSDKEVSELSRNKYIKNVTPRGITYTNEFKLQLIAEYEVRKSSRKIFEDAEFNIETIGTKRIYCANLRCRTSCKSKRVLEL